MNLNTSTLSNGVLGILIIIPIKAATFQGCFNTERKFVAAVFITRCSHSEALDSNTTAIKFSHILCPKGLYNQATLSIADRPRGLTITMVKPSR